MQIVSVKSQSALSGVQQNLREGDFVFVRALKDLGGGKYSVSFAGGRFNVVSERALVPGQTFRAQISFAGGKILLTPQKAAAESSGAEFLKSLGLAADGVDERILAFLTQSGAKIDLALMQKARRLAQKFKGREAAAAEAVLALEEKGIESDSPALDMIMDFVDGEGSGSEGSNGKDGQGEPQGRDFGQDQNSSQAGGGQTGSQDQSGSQVQNDGGLDEGSAQIAKELKRYFNFMLESAALRGQPNGSEDGQEAAAILALFNQSGGRSASSAKKGWLFFPFEIEGSGPASFLGRGGVIRLYSDFERNAVEKMIINFKSYSGNIYFALYFGLDKKVSTVHLCASEKSLEEILRNSLETLKSAFGESVNAEVISFEKFSPLGVAGSPLFGVEAFA